MTSFLPLQDDISLTLPKLFREGPIGLPAVQYDAEIHSAVCWIPYAVQSNGIVFVLPLVNIPS